MSNGTRATPKGKPKTTGTRYDADYRREALRLIDGGKSRADDAAELGVSVGTLERWQLKATTSASRGAPPGAAGESVTAENDRLKRELKALRTELEFAKKAAAFFARDGR